MLIVETIANIRRDYYVHGKGLRRIARERKVSRNTVRKVIRGKQNAVQLSACDPAGAQNG